MNPKKVICPCRDVTKGDILKAIEKGAASYKDVKKATGAGSKCGKCEKKVRKFIKKHRKEGSEE
ncbi:MAG: (2Fe-2S)-binding protein [Clostridiaceae bacterium]|nr:(2Fe-2S)-binding protein [Clostridiaceae bacterium]